MMGLVIAGGQSKRMGCDKATLIFRGLPLHLRAADALRPVVQKVFISLRPDSSFRADIQDYGLFDGTPELGPGSALVSAAQAEIGASFVVVACDFPYADRLSVQNLLNNHDERFAIVCYQHDDQTPEPLFAIWSAVALQQLQKNFEAGARGPMATLLKFHAQGAVKMVVPSDARLLTNTNTPDEWAQIEGET